MFQIGLGSSFTLQATSSIPLTIIITTNTMSRDKEEFELFLDLCERDQNYEDFFKAVASGFISKNYLPDLSITEKNSLHRFIRRNHSSYLQNRLKIIYDYLLLFSSVKGDKGCLDFRTSESKPLKIF